MLQFVASEWPGTVHELLLTIPVEDVGNELSLLRWDMAAPSSDEEFEPHIPRCHLQHKLQTCTHASDGNSGRWTDPLQ